MAKTKKKCLESGKPFSPADEVEVSKTITAIEALVTSNSTASVSSVAYPVKKLNNKFFSVNLEVDYSPWFDLSNLAVDKWSDSFATYQTVDGKTLPAPLSSDATPSTLLCQINADFNLGVLQSFKAFMANVGEAQRLLQKLKTNIGKLGKKVGLARQQSYNGLFRELSEAKSCHKIEVTLAPSWSDLNLPVVYKRSTRFKLGNSLENLTNSIRNFTNDITVLATSGLDPLEVRQNHDSLREHWNDLSLEDPALHTIMILLTLLVTVGTCATCCCVLLWKASKIAVIRSLRAYLI